MICHRHRSEMWRSRRDRCGSSTALLYSHSWRSNCIVWGLRQNLFHEDFNSIVTTWIWYNPRHYAKL